MNYLVLGQLRARGGIPRPPSSRKVGRSSRTRGFPSSSTVSTGGSSSPSALRSSPGSSSARRGAGLNTGSLATRSIPLGTPASRCRGRCIGTFLGFRCCRRPCGFDPGCGHPRQDGPEITRSGTRLHRDHCCGARPPQPDRHHSRRHSDGSAQQRRTCTPIDRRAFGNGPESCRVRSCSSLSAESS